MTLTEGPTEQPQFSLTCSDIQCNAWRHVVANAGDVWMSHLTDEGWVFEPTVHLWFCPMHAFLVHPKALPSGMPPLVASGGFSKPKDPGPSMIGPKPVYGSVYVGRQRNVIIDVEIESDIEAAREVVNDLNTRQHPGRFAVARIEVIE